VADSTRALRVLETHHAPTYYMPPGDVAATMRPVAGETFCEWKGVARYFDVAAGSAVARRAAWAYPRPEADFARLANRVAFYPGLMDGAWVGDLWVLPRPGHFYGGWVTPNLMGRIKGAPGTPPVSARADYPRTPDGRYFVVRGRLWRCTNPSLPEPERRRLTAALMDARRAVGSALKRGDQEALKAARAAVNEAKIALGERGPVWWTDGAPDLNRRMARTSSYADWWRSVEECV